jgi:hypothetical protein
MSRFGGHIRLGHNFAKAGGVDGAKRVDLVLMSVHEATNTYSIIIAMWPAYIEREAKYTFLASLDTGILVLYLIFVALSAGAPGSDRLPERRLKQEGIPVCVSQTKQVRIIQRYLSAEELGVRWL